MKEHKTKLAEFIHTICEKHPAASTLAVARMAYKQAPQWFSGLGAARSAVRYHRGERKGGGGMQAEIKTPTPAPHTALPALPEGKTFFKDWKPLLVPGPCRALVISDLHIPYHDKPAVMAALEFGKRQAVDTIIINGDLADCFALSFWEKDPRERDFKNEIETVKSFMSHLRGQFPKAKIIYKLGNHEERFERYMRLKAPELLGINAFTLASIFDLKEDVVSEKRPIRLGTLNIIHGHEYRFAISNPVNPARGLFLRAKAHALCGHFHQTSAHSDKTVEDKNIGTWSAGCLCELHPDYSPMNNWNHGFAFVEVFENNKFHVQNKYIRSGIIY